MAEMEIDTNPSEVNSVTLRPMLCNLNAHTRADGSALFTQGDTAVTATINGPTDVKLHNLHIDKAHVDVLYHSKSGQITVADKLREQIIKNTCETTILSILYPRSAIVLQIHEMENGGGLMACAINAACLALLNSGISMKMLLAGVHCVIDESGELILDPDQSQCEKGQASLTFVFDSIEKNTIATHTTGRFTIDQYNDALTQCKQASATIFQFYRDAIRKFNKIA